MTDHQMIVKLEKEIDTLKNDRDEKHIAARKFWSHILWLVIGIVISIAIAHIPQIGAWAYGLTGLPTVGLEIIDRYFRW